MPELKYRVAASMNDGKVCRSDFHSKEGAEIIAYMLLPGYNFYKSIWIEVIR